MKYKDFNIKNQVISTHIYDLWLETCVKVLANTTFNMNMYMLYERTEYAIVISFSMLH